MAMEEDMEEERHMRGTDCTVGTYECTYCDRAHP
jgi:hypothetical protein